MKPFWDEDEIKPETRLQRFKRITKNVVRDLFPKTATIVLTTILISFVSFRTFWLNDVFHVVVFTNLIQKFISRNIVKRYLQ